MGPECFNLACIVGISYAEPLNSEAFDLFKIPLTLSERAGKIIGNVANCNSHNGKPGNPIISNNEWSGNNTSANLSCYKICATMRRKSISMNQWKTWTVMRKNEEIWCQNLLYSAPSRKIEGSSRSRMDKQKIKTSYKFCKSLQSRQIQRQQ